MTISLAMLDSTDNVITNSTYTFSNSFEIVDEEFNRSGIEIDDMPYEEKMLITDFVSTGHTIVCKTLIKSLSEKNNLILLSKGTLGSGTGHHDYGLKFICDPDYPSASWLRVWMTNLKIPHKTGNNALWEATFTLIEGEPW